MAMGTSSAASMVIMMSVFIVCVSLCVCVLVVHVSHHPSMMMASSAMMNAHSMLFSFVSLRGVAVVCFYCTESLILCQARLYFSCVAIKLTRKLNVRLIIIEEPHHIMILNDAQQDTSLSLGYVHVCISTNTMDSVCLDTLLR